MPPTGHRGQRGGGRDAEAADLIDSLLEARGYPRASFEQRAADVSVNYPLVMDNYRLAHTIAVRTGLDEATTEELRTASGIPRFPARFDNSAAKNLSRRSRSSLTLGQYLLPIAPRLPRRTGRDAKEGIKM
jgi:hypothetical protein